MFASYGQESIDYSQVLPSDWISIDHPILSLATIVTFHPIKSDRKLPIFFKDSPNKLSRNQPPIQLSCSFHQKLPNQNITHQAVAQAFKNKGD